ncbi:MAG: hypothetical protein U9N34_00655 [Candidatus Cloacimonadota bacterium]|nr:hypothetical protein [Candidatus Cloacimonadota bacterium]
MPDQLTQNCEKSSELLEEVFNCWEISGHDEETNDEFRKPMSKKQMDKSQNLLDQVIQIDCDDEWVKERTEELQNVVNNQNKRVFQGRSIIGKLVMIYAILFYFLPLPMFLNSEFTSGRKEKRIEKRIHFLNRSIVSHNKRIHQIENSQKKYKDMSEKDKEKEIAKSKEHIEKNNKKIEKYKNTDYNVSPFLTFFSILSSLFLGIIFLITGIKYKTALSPPQFLIDAREKKANMGVSFTAKFLAGLGVVGEFFASLIYKITKLMMTQDMAYTLKTKMSDGSEKSETGFNPLPIIGAAIAVGSILYVVVMIIVLSPIYVGYNYLKNYKWYR